jgi:hypothetical protein
VNTMRPRNVDDLTPDELASASTWISCWSESRY